MNVVRVLLVDDSVVIRRMLTDALATDPEIEVVATSSNGRLALQRLAIDVPDVVVMDIEMPELNGLETLPHLRKLYPKLPVIMFSTLTTSGGKATLEALALGASDYVAKPANMGSIAATMERIRADLIPKIKALGGRGPDVVTSVPQRPIAGPRVAPAPLVRRQPPTLSARVDAVVIGVSTGGPNALQAIIPKLPADLAVPLFVVQHMPKLFTRLLAERLDGLSLVTVAEAQPGIVAQSGTVLIAPGDFHMTLVRRDGRVEVALDSEPPENSCRPSVDPLFRSAAQIYGSGTLAVVLTGMGKDGLAGVETVTAAGGQCFAQDEATSVVWGMPGFVTRAGLADCNLGLDGIATELVRRCSHGRNHVIAHSGVKVGR